MTKAQIAAFEALAVGQAPIATPKTIAALVRKGLLVQSEDRLIGRDSFGDIKVPTYEIPLPIHMQWCAWCDENIPEDEINAE